ncbi:MAG: ABC transporter permease [Microvirga sp.]|nr:ABC transporter permease [Microvirga sp.]
MTIENHARSTPAPSLRRRSMDLRIARWRDGWKRFRQHRLALIGLSIFLVFTLIGLAAPLFAPYGPFELVGRRLQPPSSAHFFGTDHLGRDIFSGVLYGARTSLQVGVFATVLSAALGIVVGAVAGFYGGRVDDLLMRLAEVFQVLPRFFLALIIVALFGASLWGMIFVIGILSWAEIARLVRSEFLTLRERPFVRAAKAYGASEPQIMFREILPNALTAVIVAASLQVPSAIILEASLSFIGAGDASVMSWGRMLNNAQQFMRQAWWTAVFPGIAISLMAMSIALLADGVNDFFNPRLRDKV